MVRKIYRVGKTHNFYGSILHIDCKHINIHQIYTYHKNEHILCIFGVYFYIDLLQGQFKLLGGDFFTSKY